jgi:hypothetical protein
VLTSKFNEPCGRGLLPVLRCKVLSVRALSSGLGGKAMRFSLLWLRGCSGSERALALGCSVSATSLRGTRYLFDGVSELASIAGWI